MITVNYEYECESGGVVKSFFRDGPVATATKASPPFDYPQGAGDVLLAAPVSSSVQPTPDSVTTPCAARVAVYDAPAAAPRTEDVFCEEPREFIERVSARVHSLAREAGGSVPYTVIREVVENFIHADFVEPVVSVLDGGSTIRFADQGPGVPDKKKAALPGFSTASADMKRIIRGVGSGLPIVREFLDHSGGTLLIEDNLREGTVVTVSCERENEGAFSAAVPSPPETLLSFEGPPLTTRQKQVLSLVLELGEVGPTIVSRELSVALSTAYRDLALLENTGLIEADETGKRFLTEDGSRFLDSLFNQ